MYTYVATALLAASAAATGAWQIQNWRYHAKEAEHVEQQAEAQRVAAATAIRRQETVIDAQNQAETRARGLRLDAAGSRAALDGLRASTDAALRAAAASQDACLVRAASLGELLEASADEYRKLGEAADRHTNDLQTLMAAWPK